MVAYLASAKVVFEKSESWIVRTSFSGQGRSPGRDSRTEEGPGDDLTAVVEQLEGIRVMVAVELERI